MQLTKNGPDIPDRLLEAHEDGKVVFFCGAGISYPAGLPGFRGLLDKTYKSISEIPSGIEISATKRDQYDTVFGLLENRIVGGRKVVRKAICDILTPNLSLPNATISHEALLTLGRTREGNYRLVTTNFDRLFIEAQTRMGIEVPHYKAPLPPVPKNRWSGLVYLHGLFNGSYDEGNLNEIVISSGDFGLAYLTERWAARFAGELFRNFTVCFVGYSINDPVLRYMMDALAADRLLGENTPEAFAFGSYSKNKYDIVREEWEAKNVTAILYREYGRHHYLHRSLSEWAAVYRDGVIGKERIVSRHAIAKPLLSTRQDDFVGRVLWALSDPSGIPAKSFSRNDPVPSLDWLEPLSDQRYGIYDLKRFGIEPNPKRDRDNKFSVLRRPTPHTLAPSMAISYYSYLPICHWDDVMKHLAQWLLRHVNNPRLFLWIAKNGSVLHPYFRNMLEFEIKDKPDRFNKVSRTLWSVFLSGRTKDGTEAYELYGWIKRYKSEGLHTLLRYELLEKLEPCVKFSEPFRIEKNTMETHSYKTIREVVNWDILLKANHVHEALRFEDQQQEARWHAELSEIIIDLTKLLESTLDLMQELGGASDKSDRSYVAQPSISPHSQNNDFNDWTALIDLTRDAWLASLETNRENARLAVPFWATLKYPLFRRFVFFAASRSGDLFTSQMKVHWLLSDDCWWLWSNETLREAIRLLVWMAANLQEEESEIVQSAILKGPPREMYREDLSDEQFREIVDREVWLRLAKFQSADGSLTEQAIVALESLSETYPNWRLATDERDEFPYWTGEGDDFRTFRVTPKRTRELTVWLRNNPETDFWQEDDWRDRCQNDFRRCVAALLFLSRQDVWLPVRWREAIQVWSNEDMVSASWHWISDAISHAPDDFILAIDPSLGHWLRSAAKSIDENIGDFFTILYRVLNLHEEEQIEPVDDIVTRAINHPVGEVTSAALRWWYRQGLDDDQGMRGPLAPFFKRLCNPEIASYMYGRVELGTHAVTFFRVDREWFEQYLLPFFDWGRSFHEARAVWSGFLGSPRLYEPLVDAFKSQFLETARHYEALGEYGRQYARIFAIASIELSKKFTQQELREATALLPVEGLSDMADTVVRSLESAAEQREAYWENRVKPFLQRVWPKDPELVTQSTSENFARLAIAAGDAFPDAVDHLRHWFRPVDHPHFVVHRLNEARLCGEFPEAALLLLDAVIRGEDNIAPRELGDCLRAMSDTLPDIESDQRYIRLMIYYRRTRAE